MLIMMEVILWTVSGYSYTYEQGGGGGGGGEAGVKLLTHLRTKAPYEADMTQEFPTQKFSSPTNVSKSATNASWPRPLDLTAKVVELHPTTDMLSVLLI